MTTDTATTEKVFPTGKGGGSVPYLALVAAQSAGAAIVLVNGVPIYRQISLDAAHHEPRPGILWWAVTALVLMQGAYWSRIYLQPSMPGGRHLVVGHLAAFVARLSFIFSSSTFVVVFLVHFEQLSLPWHRIVMVLAILFSMFCYTLELERLARALHTRD